MYAVFHSVLNFLLGSPTYMIGHLQQTLGFLVFCWFSGEQYMVICLSDHWLLLSWSESTQESTQESEILILLCSSTKVIISPSAPPNTHISQSSLFFLLGSLADSSAPLNFLLNSNVLFGSVYFPQDRKGQTLHIPPSPCFL